MTYTPPEQPSQGGYQPAGQQPADAVPGYQAASGYQAPSGYQPAGGYQPADAYQGGYGATASTSKKLSWWGLSLGISSIVLPFFLNAIAGGVLSGIGIVKEPEGKTLAIWGLVLSIVGLIVAALVWFVFVPLVLLAWIGTTAYTMSGY